MRLLISVAVMAALISACGGDSKNDATPTTAPPTAAPQPTPTASACATAPAAPQFATVFSATATVQTQGVLTSVDAATGACSDTATFTFSGAEVPSYEVKYVQAADECGSGMPVTTAGSAQITVRFEPAVAHDDAGKPTVSQRTFAPNFASIKELTLSCDFEAVVVWVIGTESKYYTVTKLSNPPRLVIEMSH